MGKDAEIIINTGGKLIINGATLTKSTLNTWQGITVLGNANLSQTPSSNQGYLEITSEAKIENAEIAVYVGKRGINPSPEDNGGIIEIEDAEFRNNIIGICFESYHDISGLPIPNVSFIKNSRFETTDVLATLNKTPDKFISLFSTDGIDLDNNDFINSNPQSYGNKQQGDGICSWNANYSSTYNTFENLVYGIEANGTGSLSSFEIDNCTFNANYKSVYLEGTTNAIVTRNTINFTGYGGGTTTGIYATFSNDFTIEENIITGSGTGNFDRGIALYGNPQTNNSVYLNEFSNITYGTMSENSPNLFFECNEFSGNNNYGIRIKDDGAAMYQGNGFFNYFTGNKFFQTCNSFDISSTHDIVYYYTTTLNSYRPTLVNNNIDVALAFNKPCNTCLPHPHFGGGGMNMLIALDEEIQEKETQLDEMVDGGDTESTVSEVENANQEEALKLRNSLLAKSPNLSDTVMVTTVVEEDILPEIMLTEVLSANSQSAKSENVNNALNERQNQLPAYLRNEINLGRNSISPKEELEIEIQTKRYERARIFNNKVRYFMQDTLQSSKDSLLFLLENENNVSGSYRLLSYYLSQKDHANAELVFSSIPTDFELTAKQESDYNKMAIVTEIQIDLLENEKTYFDIDSLQKQALYALSEDTLSQAGAYARSIISLVDGVEYDFNFPYPEEQYYYAPPPNHPELVFNLTPNPADDYFVAEYELPVSSFTTASFKMYDFNKNKVYEQTLSKRAYQLLVETAKFVPGTYLCKLFADGKEYGQELITIKADQMTAEQQEQSEEFTISKFQNFTNYFTVFPNPAKDVIFVKYNIDSKNSINDLVNGVIIINDNLGKDVKSKQIQTNSGQVSISVSDLSRGVYIISLLIDGEIIETEKIVVE